MAATNTPSRGSRTLLSKRRDTLFQESSLTSRPARNHSCFGCVVPHAGTSTREAVAGTVYSLSRTPKRIIISLSESHRQGRPARHRARRRVGDPRSGLAPSILPWLMR